MKFRNSWDQGNYTQLYFPLEIRDNKHFHHKPICGSQCNHNNSGNRQVFSTKLDHPTFRYRRIALKNFQTSISKHFILVRVHLERTPNAKWVEPLELIVKLKANITKCADVSQSYTWIKSVLSKGFKIYKVDKAS